MKILIIDDQTSILESLSLFFDEKGYEIITANSGRKGLEKVTSEEPDIVILDIHLQDLNGIDVLRDIKAISERTHIIMITAYHDMEKTIEVMKMGAYDYIRKPINIEELDFTVQKIAETIELKNKLSIYIEDQKDQNKLDTIIGNTRSMLQIFKMIGLTCNNRATLLIQGETGTGKGLIAKAIHYNGMYKKEPFVNVNCSALVDTLLESELFGHEKGAFTHAIQQKKGKFELAGDGTIFLDEIGELPLHIQVKLLRFLQEREFERVGSESTIKSNARIIAASNRNITQLVQEGKFREDLSFRLKIVTINVPTLRERKSDIPLLVEFFLQKFSKELHKEQRQISNEALDKLMSYDWPGNVRELENVIMRALVLSREDVIMGSDISLEAMKDQSYKEEKTALKSLEEAEKELITRVFISTKGHLGKTCDLLKISRPTLRKKMEKYDIQMS
jgi:two-component system response regulator AtoC